MFKFVSALLVAVASAQFRGRGMRINRRRLAGNEGRVKASDVEYVAVDFRKLNWREDAGINKAARDWQFIDVTAIGATHSPSDGAVTPATLFYLLV